MYKIVLYRYCIAHAIELYL